MIVDYSLLYVVCSKSIASFQFPRVTYIRFSIFCGAMSVLISCRLMSTSSAILNVQLIFDSYFPWTCFGSCSMFASSVSGTIKVTEGQICGIRWLRQHYCLFLTTNSRINNDVWAGALSWCKSQFLFFHKSGRFCRIASRTLRITCR